MIMRYSVTSVFHRSCRVRGNALLEIRHLRDGRVGLMCRGLGLLVLATFTIPLAVDGGGLCCSCGVNTSRSLRLSNTCSTLLRDQNASLTDSTLADTDYTSASNLTNLRQVAFPLPSSFPSSFRPFAPHHLSSLSVHTSFHLIFLFLFLFLLHLLLLLSLSLLSLFLSTLLSHSLILSLRPPPPSHLFFLSSHFNQVWFKHRVTGDATYPAIVSLSVPSPASYSLRYISATPLSTNLSIHPSLYLSAFSFFEAVSLSIS